MKVTSSAPGKVVLCGEYAVLDGAAAIVAAIDRRAHVTATFGTNNHHVVTATGIAAAPGQFTVIDGHFEWLRGGAEYALLECVWRALAAPLPDRLVLTLDTQEFVDAGTATKFGIGSSAALVTALVAALDCVAGSNADIERVAMSAHRDFQSGVGSGVDVACSSQGGVIEYRMHNRATTLAWPDDLAFAPLWSGVPASTGAKLDDLQHQESKRSRKALGIAANRVAATWKGGKSSIILDDLRRYTDALRQFSVDHDLGIFDAGHAELADVAASAGVVYKPCGAGGGDIGIVLAETESAIAAFIGVAATKKFKHLPLAIDPDGVQCNQEDH